MSKLVLDTGGLSGLLQGKRVTPWMVPGTSCSRVETSNERQSMRKLSVLAFLTAMMLFGFEVQAAQGRVRAQISAGPGPINRLIELERRKNAALRQAFFGR